MKKEFTRLTKYLIVIVVSGAAGVALGVREPKAAAFLLASATLIAVLFSIEPLKLRK